MQITELPTELLNKLPIELWILIDKYNKRNFLNESLRTIRPKFLYKANKLSHNYNYTKSVYTSGQYLWQITDYDTAHITMFLKGKMVGNV